jgi:hypothetical protein
LLWLLARRKKKLRPPLRLLRLLRPPLRLLLRPLRLTLPLPRLLRPLLKLLLRPLRLLHRLLRLLLKPLRLLLLRLLRSNSNRAKETGLRAGFFTPMHLRRVDGYIASIAYCWRSSRPRVEAKDAYHTIDRHRLDAWTA